ncbi:MAG: peptide ABC transporter substrate-binding protein [Chlamydiota bacterium]
MNIQTAFLGVSLLLFAGCAKTGHPMEKKGQDLRINLQREPASLDPRIGNDVGASQVHFMLFEGLLRLNPDMTLSPAQAKSWEISSDEKMYTFYLDDANWSNGVPVTAFDFERSWKSVLSPDFPCPDAYLLYSIKNAYSAKQGALPLSDVGIRAVDEKTLVVELELPTPHFLQIVASSVLLPINMDMEDKNPNWAVSPSHFICNGPFQFKEWKVNDEMIFEKNPYFRKANDVKLNNVFINIIDREMIALHMYASGYFDLIGAPLSCFPTVFHQELDKKNLLTFFPVAMSKFLAFNTNVFPFNNANMRRAFSYAVNRNAIVKHITQLQEEPALNIIPPVLLPEEAPPLFIDADLEKARECLEVGLKELNITKDDLKNLSFMYCSSELNHLITQHLQNEWSKVLGITVRLENVDFKALHERSSKGDYEIGLFIWVAEYGDAMNILERFCDKKSHRNYSKWSHLGYNEILNQAMKTSCPKERFEKILEAEKILVDEMPITCLFHSNYAFLIQPHVRGFGISPLGQIYFDQISIAP